MRHRTITNRRTKATAMTRCVAMLPLVLLIVGALALGVAARSDAGGNRIAQLPDDVELQIADLLEAAASGNLTEAADAEPFDDSEMFFEENARDGDLGIQFFLDGEPWERVFILGANGRRLVDLKVKGSARVIGLTELFSESAEPEFTKLPREEFLALFPEGDYLMCGRTIEGDWLTGEATVTHDMPAPPDVLSPLEGEEVDPNDPLIVEWVSVPDPNPPASVIEAYQVIVEKDEEEERLRVFTFDMLSTDTSVTLAPGLLEPGKDYKVEVMAIETSENKTIWEVGFETEE